MSVHIFGIRHHGPGSARSLRAALEALQPDAILVEGPPDGDAMLPLIVHEDMEPPVALLIYVPDEPQRAVFYPFSVFSPEWQALSFGLKQAIPVRFMDLPQAHRLALTRPEATTESEPPGEAAPPAPPDQEPAEQAKPDPRADPLGALAAAAGYSDGERWWEHLVEQRRDGADLFAGILEAMAALREAAPPNTDPVEDLREAYMRKTIRAALAEGRQRIAVVCGAWHGPALVPERMPPEKEDSALLKGLPKAKVAATWVPWTHGRLTYASGYGAGIESPGWYQHLWNSPDSVAIRWLARVAGLLREEGLDASAAQVIDAVRLSESLAALRERPLPGLPELNEAVRATMCFGSDIQMKLIHEKLIVGEQLGRVPSETPMVPLQKDFEREKRRLKLPDDTPANKPPLDLDLRTPFDLDRSRLLHRLGLLGIAWGKLERTPGRLKGTFHEFWRLKWQPEFSVTLIEMSTWGNTVPDAATGYTRHAADHAPALADLTALLDRVLLADLPDAASHLMRCIEDKAALTSDVAHLMDALPPLVRVLRYGNVRQTDAGMVGHVVDGMIVRICIGLPGACSSLDDDAAAEMFKRLVAANDAISLLQNEEHLAAWRATLAKMAGQEHLHGLLAGRACRILLDAGAFDAEEAARRMGLALSTAGDLPHAAAWAEGFLAGSGTILLVNDVLWAVLDRWVAGLNPDHFTALLPLLRRTFSTFTPPERRQIGERARSGPTRLATRAVNFDPERAAAVLPLVAQLLGLEHTEKSQ